MTIITQPIRVMIDFETLDTIPSAAILSMGAVQFGLPFGTDRPRFYERASMSSNEFRHRSISRGTVEWWDKQSVEARNEAFGGTQEVDDMLTLFLEWIGTIAPAEEVEIWSRGAGFDCEILQHAFLNIFGNYPFDFRKHMCQRTVERLMPLDLKALAASNGMKHHALQDAIYQADLMDIALRNINWKVGYSNTVEYTNAS